MTNLYKALKNVDLMIPLYDELGQATGYYGGFSSLEAGQSYDLSEIEKATVNQLVLEGFIEAVQ